MDESRSGRAHGGGALAAAGLLFLASLTLAGAADSLPATQRQDAPLEVLAEALVIGEQPGPALWQVRSGDHVLWILAETNLVPRKLKWRSKQVEEVLAGARELLVTTGREPPARTAEEKAREKQRSENFKLWATKRFLPAGQTLRDLLSPESYARYMAASATFAAHEKNPERLVPDHANTLLLSGSIRTLKLGLSPVTDKVIDLAKRRRITVTRVEPLTWRFYATWSDAELMYTCVLERLLLGLADDAARMKERINAWSVGDVEKLRQLTRLSSSPAAEMGSTCTAPVEGSAAWRKASQMRDSHRKAWLDATERALAANASTLAVLSVADVLERDGVLEALRSRGYEIVEP